MSRYRGDPESGIQARVVKLFRLAGCKVYPTSQYRVSRQAVGMADLFVVHPGKRVAFWWECKAPSGKLSNAQWDFCQVVRAVGVEYEFGGYEEAVHYLECLGVIVPQTKRTA